MNWLPVTEKFNQSMNSMVFKYAIDQYPNYLNEVFKTTPEKKFKLEIVSKS